MTQLTSLENTATSARYAVRSNDIYVKENHLTGTGTGTALGGSDLGTTLSGVYGKVYLAEPDNPAVGDLWYDAPGLVLKYCSAVSAGSSATWLPIFSGSISGKFYSTTSATPAGAAAAAQAELYAHRDDTQPSGIGDIVLVTVTSPSGYESFICVGAASSITAPSDYTVEHTTAGTGSEIRYDGQPAGHYLTPNQTITEALTTLGNQTYNNCDYGRFTVTVSGSDASGATIAADTGDSRGMPDKNFTGFTGLLKFTCCIDCTAVGTAYSTFGIITAAVVNGAIESGSMSLVDYYAKGDGHPTGTEADVFNIDFEIDSSTHLLSLTVPNTSTVKAGTTITVKAQW